MRDLIDDERIHQIPESLLGPDFWLDGADGHLRAGDTPWHGSDGHDDDLGWVKVAIYLDPLNRDSGCLRVIPDAHRWHGADLFAALRKVDQSKDFRPFGMRADEIRSVALETEPGDVLVFTERLIHRAFGGGIGRYQVCANFVANPETERHIAQIEQFYDASTWSLRPTTDTPDGARAPRVQGDSRGSISNLRSSLAPTVRQGTEPLRIQGGIKCPTHYPRQGMNPIQYDSCIGYTARVA